jgi:amidase
MLNKTDYSACVVPVTWADKAIDVKSKQHLSYTPLDKRDRKVWEEYDPKVYHHGPVAIQIITRKLEVEKSLGIAQVVVGALARRNGAKGVIPMERSSGFQAVASL